MPAYNFQERFAPAVESGEKRQTIRRRRKRRTRVCETLYLYTGMRSKRCRLLMEAECVEVCPVEFGDGGVNLDGWSMLAGSPNADAFARADGFGTFEEMREWFRERYGLPFRGELIRWRPKEEAPDAE